MARHLRSGSEILVNSTYARTQAQAEVATFANGDFMVVWIDADFNTTAGRHIRGQRYAADGTPIGGETTLLADLNGGTEPAVTPLAGGGYVVTWSSLGALSAQRFSDADVPLGAPFSVGPTAPASGIARADVAALDHGGFAVVWEDSRTAGADVSGTGIRLRLFAADGTAIGSELLVNTATSRNQGDASVAALANGRLLVTWTDRGAGWVAKAQLFEADGSRVGGEFVLNASTGGSAVETSTVALAGGGFAVAWYESGAHQVQIFDANGVAQGLRITTTANLSGTQVGPELAALSDGSLALASRADVGPQSDGSGSTILVQVFGADGTAQGDPLRVNTQGSGDQIDPSIAALPGGAFVVTWTDLAGTGADDDEVRAQLFALTPEVEITSSGGSATAAFTVAENDTLVTQVAASSPLPGATVTYSIAGGADAARFTVDAQTGALAFAAGPDHESPGDADGDNLYDVIVEASDGSTSDRQAIRVTVANVAEGVEILSPAALTADENSFAITTVSAIAPGGAAIAYAIAGGADAHLFAIDSATGALAFIATPGFEGRSDANGDNVFDVAVSATAGDLSDVQAFALTLRNVNEGFGGAWVDRQYTLDENNSWVDWLWAPDLDGDAVTYTITGGADAARFTLLSGSGLQFAAAPDYEAPNSASGLNSYEVRVTASDGTFSEERTFLVTIVNVEEAVRITSNGGGDTATVTLNENIRVATTVRGVDGDNQAVSYSIVGGADASLFTIDPWSGTLSFNAAPDFEAPTDAGGNNVYDVIVSAADGSSTDTQALAIRIADAREGRTINGNSLSNTISPTSSTISYRTTEQEDTIYAGGGNDTIDGAGGNDYIDAGSGNDVLIGGHGADDMTGGSGADRFVFQKLGDSPSAQPDRIRDFGAWQGDRIDLSAIDANSGVAGDQSFTFIGTSAFSGVAGQLRWEKSGTTSFVSGDVDGDGLADFRIQLDYVGGMAAADFIL